MFIPTSYTKGATARLEACKKIHCLGQTLTVDTNKLSYTCLYYDLGTTIPGNILSFGSGRITLLSLIFRRWKNFIVWQNIFRSQSMCRCILLDKLIHD